MSENTEVFIKVAIAFGIGVAVGKIVKSAEVAQKIHELYAAGGYVVAPIDEDPLNVEVINVENVDI